MNNDHWTLIIRTESALGNRNPHYWKSHDTRRCDLTSTARCQAAGAVRSRQRMAQCAQASDLLDQRDCCRRRAAVRVESLRQKPLRRGGEPVAARSALCVREQELAARRERAGESDRRL